MKKIWVLVAFFLLSACSLRHYTYIDNSGVVLEKPVTFNVSVIESGPMKNFFVDGYCEKVLKDEIEFRLKKSKLYGNDYSIEVEIEDFWPGQRSWIISGDCSASVKFTARIKKGSTVYRILTTSYMQKNENVMWTISEKEGISRSCGMKTVNSVLRIAGHSLVDAIEEELVAANGMK